jgi:hypothetical protein
MNDESRYVRNGSGDPREDESKHAGRFSVGQWDAGELVEQIVIEESLAAVAAKATVRLVATPELPRFKTGLICDIKTSDGETLLLRGLAWTVLRPDQGLERVEITVIDPSIYLDRSEDECLWPGGETATSRIRRYAGDWEVKLGTLAETGVPLGKAVYRARTITDMVFSDLRETVRQGGGLFRPRMETQEDGSSLLSLVEIGKGTATWKLESVYDITYSETLDEAVTKVKVLGAVVEDTRSPVLAVVTGQTELGNIQRVLQDEQITTPAAAQAAGKALLAGPQQTVRVTAPDEPAIRAGDLVTLADDQTYIVCNVVHRLGQPGEMQLELGTEDYVRRRYYARSE